jgi:hypothetical protein
VILWTVAAFGGANVRGAPRGPPLAEMLWACAACGVFPDSEIGALPERAGREINRNFEPYGFR